MNTTLLIFEANLEKKVNIENDALSLLDDRICAIATNSPQEIINDFYNYLENNTVPEAALMEHKLFVYNLFEYFNANKISFSFLTEKDQIAACTLLSDILTPNELKLNKNLKNLKDTKESYFNIALTKDSIEILESQDYDNECRFAI